MYRASSADKLYDRALKIVSALIPVIREADFDLAIKDTDIEAECLYSGALDAISITLWAVKRELALDDHALPERGSLEGLENFDETRGTALAGPYEQITAED